MNKLLSCTRGPWREAFPILPFVDGEYSNDADLYPNQDEDPVELAILPHEILDAIDVYCPKRGRVATEDEHRANATLIAAAFDHALIWWAEKHCGWHFECFSGEARIWEDVLKRVFPDTLPLDPFGFPILTDDLRARLIAKMEN